MDMEKSLIDLKKGETAEIIDCGSGHSMAGRLQSMGVRPGKKISRVSSQLMGGPIIIDIDGRQTAMGRGMAAKVKVRPISE